MHPEQLTIKKLDPKDVSLLQQLIRLFSEVFATENSDPANERHLTTLLAKKEFIVFVAMHGNEIVGGLTAYVMPMYYTEHAEAYIYDIATRQDFQRMGIGKSLILSLKEYCGQNGIREIFVEAHEEDTHAVDFYRSIGGEPEKVVHFNFKIHKAGA